MDTYILYFDNLMFSQLQENVKRKLFKNLIEKSKEETHLFVQAIIIMYYCKIYKY